MKGHEGDIFSKASDQKPLFLFKIKIKQNPGCLNKEYNVVFKHFHKNIRAYPSSNVAYWEESEQSNVLLKKFRLSQTQLGCLGKSQCQESFAVFRANLGNSISST